MNYEYYGSNCLPLPLTYRLDSCVNPSEYERMAKSQPRADMSTRHLWLTYCQRKGLSLSQEGTILDQHLKEKGRFLTLCLGSSHLIFMGWQEDSFFKKKIVRTGLRKKNPGPITRRRKVRTQPAEAEKEIKEGRKYERVVIDIYNVKVHF